MLAASYKNGGFMSLRLFFVIILLSFIVTVFAQVSFEQTFSIERYNNFMMNMQLYDINNDQEDEVIISYANYSGELSGKSIIYNQFGDTLSSINYYDDWRFRYASLFRVQNINYLSTIFQYQENNGNTEEDVFLSFKILRLDNLTLIDSSLIYIGTNDLIVNDYYNFTVNFIEYTYSESDPNIYIGIDITYLSSGEISYSSSNSHLIRYLLTDNLLNLVDSFGNVGKSIKINTDTNQVIISGLSTQSMDDYPLYCSTSKTYQLVSFPNEYDPVFMQLDFITGLMESCYDSTSYNNYLTGDCFLTNNDMNINELGLMSFYIISDDTNGITTNFKNFSPNFEDTLWIKYDTQIGAGSLTSSTSISVNNEDHYVLYFRGNQLEIRDRDNGNIIHYQDSAILPFRILRNSNNEFLFFENGVGSTYDIYKLNGEIQVSADGNLIEKYRNNLINFPNPFNPTTTIKFSIKENSNIDLSIYNVKGQKVITLAKREFTKGSHSLVWNGNDETDKSVSSGIYYYVLNVDSKIKAIKKCLLLK